MSVWLNAASSTKTISCFAIAVLSDTSPLQLRANRSFYSEPEVGATPVSLPATPDVGSPDTHGQRSFEEIDPYSRLLDRKTEAWAIPTAHSVRGPRGQLDLEMSLAGGYIMERNEVLFEVSLVFDRYWGLKTPELLNAQYRLACLAKARGGSAFLPWHLLSARQAHAGLCGLH